MLANCFETDDNPIQTELTAHDVITNDAIISELQPSWISEIFLNLKKPPKIDSKRIKANRKSYNYIKKKRGKFFMEAFFFN